MDLEVRPANETDREFIETSLRRNDLPLPNPSEQLDYLYICEKENDPVGVCGLEQYQGVDLLRSLVIRETVRGVGCGTELCTDLLDRARANGATKVYLLTTTAEEFFSSLGFQETIRESIPESIQKNSELCDSCPSTAVSMKRELDSQNIDNQGVK